MLHVLYVGVYRSWCSPQRAGHSLEANLPLCSYQLGMYPLESGPHDEIPTVTSMCVCVCVCVCVCDSDLICHIMHPQYTTLRRKNSTSLSNESAVTPNTGETSLAHSHKT